MLSKKANFLETIRGGKPDRFVKQHEFIANCVGRDPFTACYPIICAPGGTFVSAWGVTIRYDIGQPGPFPVHDAEHRVLTDIARWREVVKAPSLDFSKQAWDDFVAFAESVDRDEYLLTLTYVTGIFEQLHYLMGMEDTLVNFYAEPEETAALINFLTDFAIEYLGQVFAHVKVDCFFMGDDLGSGCSTFMSPEMMREFLLPAWRRIYSFVKTHGVEVVIHHSDSYAATLVPIMIESGVDVWQGVMSTNDVPDLVRRYGGQISFMGGLDNSKLDVADWTEKMISDDVSKMCRESGKKYFVPCLISAGPESTYPGVYEAVNRQIDRMSKEMF